MTFVRKDYITLLFYGISLTCCAYVDERIVQYKGAKEVWEGEPFKITCVLAYHDLEGWTINSTIISEDNALGYFLSERTIDPFRKEVILQAKSAQLHHEGAYRCNRYSRDYHYLKILPAWAEGNDPEKDSTSKPTNEYILKINKTIKFYCSSAKDDNIPVTWYKNSRRILETVESNVFTDGLSLIIENAQEDDAGEYMCAIDNPHVTGYTDIGRLFRLNSPPKIAEISHNERVIQRRHLKIRCKVKGYPPPKVIWFIGNLNATKLKETDPRIHLYSTDDGSTIFHLDIQNVSFSDRGLFTCKAENSLDSGTTMSYDEASVFVHVMGK